MNDRLRQESEKLARSWMQHKSGWLREYLVAGVEDPRINIQSILSRHFLLRALCGERFITWPLFILASAWLSEDWSCSLVSELYEFKSQVPGHCPDHCPGHERRYPFPGRNSILL